MSTTGRAMTVADLRQMPELRNGDWYELHGGELVRTTRPVLRHLWLEKRLVVLLDARLDQMGFAAAEMPFAIEAENEMRSVDVGFVFQARWDAAEKDQWLAGPPDLVIEVLSPSNTYSEIRDKQELCLRNGSREFWVVDPRRETVEVTTADGKSKVYHSGEIVPLEVFGGEGVQVTEIFA